MGDRLRKTFKTNTHTNTNTYIDRRTHNEQRTEKKKSNNKEKPLKQIALNVCEFV